jgi:hypothetical protein
MLDEFDLLCLTCSSPPWPGLMCTQLMCIGMQMYADVTCIYHLPHQPPRAGLAAAAANSAEWLPAAGWTNRISLQVPASLASAGGKRARRGAAEKSCRGRTTLEDHASSYRSTDSAINLTSVHMCAYDAHRINMRCRLWG